MIISCRFMSCIYPHSSSLMPWSCILSRGHTWLATGRRPPCDQNFGWSQGGCRAVAKMSAIGRRPVADGCRDDLVARRFWLLQVKPLCDQIERRKVFGGRRQVANRSPTGWRLIAEQLQRLQTIPTQFLVADWSPTSRRSVADRSPKSCTLSVIKNKRSRYSRQPVADRSPTSRRPVPHLIADLLPTDCRGVGNHCLITRHCSINTRSLSAPEPMLDLFSVSSSDINLKTILWRQFYKRYFNHRSLKLAHFIHLIFLSNSIIDCLVWNTWS